MGTTHGSVPAMRNLVHILWFAAACGTAPDVTPDDTGDAPVVRGDAPDAAPPPSSLKRLTTAQYRHAMRDLFGPDLVLPARLEPDERIDGLFAVGAANTTISSYGAERYAQAAYDVAAQVLGDETRRARWIDCDLANETCIEDVLAALGRHAWRRPLAQAELDDLVDIVVDAEAVLESDDDAFAYAMAAVLMSPNFLYRVELGDEGDAPEGGYGAYELASRLAFFLWDTVPDAELLDAADDGSLLQDDVLAGQVDRMLADPRATEGVRALFGQMLHLDELDHLTKDPAIFTYLRDSLGQSAREETLRGIEALVFDDDGSYLDLFTTRRTFLDRDLAALYGVPAPAREGFAETMLPADGGRMGLLGQASFLALWAHPVSTSVTRRGVFVREVLLCEEIPEPPAMANTAIPEVSADAPTMRDRIAVHLQNPSCAACHTLTDPIGLAFENFDGLGGWRDKENGVEIDASGELDDATFADAVGAAKAIADHPNTAPCLVQTVLQVATGGTVDHVDEAWVDWHTTGFVGSGHRVLWLLRDVALSPAFRGVEETP